MNAQLSIKVEALLFISNKPLAYQKIAELTGQPAEAVKQIVNELKDKYNATGSGVKLVIQGQKVQLVTAPEAADVAEEFLKQELTGEMTRPQLETLTIIAYRGPIIKSEIEQIRGVNCSLILRNLLIRGLIELTDSAENQLPRYQITHDFLKFLGLTGVTELPDFEKLSHNENIQALLEQNKAGL